MKNKDKIKESEEEYRTKNKIKIEDYRITNKEKINEWKKEFRLKNIENLKEFRMNNKDKTQEYIIKNKDKIEENKKEFRMKNSDKLREIKVQMNPNYVPNYSWKSREQSRLNFESIALMFHITDLSDWYRISSNQMKKLGGIINRL
jgi:hypothetical protein